jgi:hypothetical protein
VYCMMMTEFGAEAWTPLPVEKWGTEYFAAARDGEVVFDVVPGPTGYDKMAKPAPGEICIIAAFDNTQVAITTNERLADLYPRSVTLNAGQTYTIQSYVNTDGSAWGDDQPDLGGARIVGTKPIAVISGNTRAQVLTEGEGLTQNPWHNMLIEWIPPVEQHGTEFVFMPTWDARRPQGEYLQYKRQAEFVRLYATHSGNTEGFYTTGEVDADVPIDPYPQAGVNEFRFGSVPPRYFRTNQPAMAMMNSAAAVRFNGLLPNGPPDIPDPEEKPEEPDTIVNLSRDYEGWGAYMVEMVPREQWTSFAPYWAPTSPGEMEHYINVVTDSVNADHIIREDGTRFFFNRGPIGNTGLIWGTMAVLPGTTHWLHSDNGGRFYAVSYGLLRGQEQYIYIPGTPPKPGLPAEDARFEHREYMAIAYGYPLSPRRNALRAPDTLQILPTMGCTELSVVVNAVNNNPSGFRVINLEPATNARIKSITPVDYVGAATATIVVEPIDKRQNATATLVIIDRTGNSWTVPYSYIAEAVTFAPAVMLDFGEQTMNIPTRRDITITNAVDKTLDITRLRMRRGTEDFTVVSSTPAVPTQLAKGQSMTVTIEANPTRPGYLYLDSLVVETACTTALHPLRMETVQPFIQVNDLSFGPVQLGQSAIRTLYLRNVGRGTVTFHDSTVNDVISWGDPHFEVSDADKARIRGMRLGPGDVDSINVRFNATETGIYRTVARVVANTRQHRDTSVWTASVRIPGPQVDAVEWDRMWLTSGDPCSKNPVAEYVDSIEIFNTGSSEFEVVSLTLTGADADAGYFVLDNSDPGATVKAGDRVRAVSGGDTMRVYQRVLFKPTVEKPDYSATISMRVVNPVSGIENTVENTLVGSGIQSHVHVNALAFDTVQFAGPGSTVVPGQVSFEVRPTRPTTITDVQVVPNDGQFVVTNAAQLTRTWQPGETGVIQLEFRPTAAGLRNARVVLVGDHSKCDTSEGALIGFTPGGPPPPPPDSAGAAVNNLAFGALLGCHDSTGMLTVRNTGTVPITVTGMTVIAGAPEFSVIPLASPVTIPVAGSSSFPVNFSPSSTATFNGQVRFDIQIAGNDSTIERVAVLTGSGAILTANASIATNLTAVSGEELQVPIMLGTAINEGKVNDLTVELRYDREAMIAQTGDMGRFTTGTILNGWTTTVVSHAATPTNKREMVLTLRATAPANTFANGTGTLLSIPFRTIIGDTMRSALPFTITSDASPCVVFNTTPGAIALDSICGLSFRLVEATNESYALRQNAPNPFNPTTTIEFGVGLDARTTLVVYDAQGRRVATLVDAYLQPGQYSVVWDASAFPSGLYYYRIVSNMWSKTNTMILQK